MAITQGRTRQQIRQSVGAAIGALNVDAGGFTHTGSSGQSSAGTTFSTPTLALGAVNEHRGKWVVVASDALITGNVGLIRRVSASSNSSGTLTFLSAMSGQTNSGTQIELWDEDMPPQVVHDFINQSITEVTRKGSVPVTSDSLHTGGGIRSFGLSSDFTGVQKVEYRYAYTGVQLVSFDDLMSSGAGITAATDSEDYKEGSASAYLSVPSGSSAADIGRSSFSTMDMSGYTHVDMWFKATQTITSSQYTIQLLNGSSVREDIAIPAINADSWTLLTLALANPWNDSAISRVTLRSGSSATSSNRIHLDDMVVYRTDAERFIEVPRKFWTVNRDSRELRFTDDATLPYAKLRVTGVRKPALLSTDTAVCEIDSDYVTESVIAKALRARADRRGSNRDAAYEQADRHEALAQAKRNRMSVPMNVRWVSD